LPYPFLTIAGIIIEPIAATVAGPDPEIAAKNAQAITVTVASPPVNEPIKTFATLTILFDNPPVSIKLPASIKNGTAINGNESTAINDPCAK